MRPCKAICAIFTANVEALLASDDEADARSHFRLCSQSQWNYEDAKEELATGNWKKQIVQILYRPFDVRWTVYNRYVAVHRRERVMHHFVEGDNLGFCTNRQVNGEFRHVFCSKHVINDCVVSPATRERTYILPLYLYDTETKKKNDWGMLTLLPVYGMPSKIVWWLIFLYCGFVCVFAMTCVPAMNTPVFAVPKGFGADIVRIDETDFKYGNVPETSISVTGAFADMLEYHTAILGVTGSGKTELAYDLLKYALAHETKVICIDLTKRYEGRLADLKPYNLSISGELSDELGQKLFDVDIGEYKASAEKKALQQFGNKLRADITGNLTAFLESTDDDKKLGIITLDEISNTKATLFIAELYLTCLLNFARDNSEQCPRVLLVVEEAHTVMPETSTMGLGDYDSKGLVASRHYPGLCALVPSW